jgi:hypothetical protein
MQLTSSTRMKPGSRLLLVLVCSSLISSGTSIAQKNQQPRFESYRVKKRFSGKPAQVNLRSHPNARLFRTMLKRSAEKGPNFAGHYTVGIWGCGSDCRTVAVIDAVTGKVYFAPFEVSTGASFRIDSRLFIANDSEIDRYLGGEEMLDVYTPSWYVWRNGRFVEIFRRQAETLRSKNRHE